jgi:metal-sulfur cluster biosynthetic enzyme
MKASVKPKQLYVYTAYQGGDNGAMRAAIPLQEIEPRADSSCCGHCLQSEQGRACGGVDPYEHCDNPTYTGPADRIAMALKALTAVVDPETGRDVVALRLVAGLKVDQDSAELWLNVVPHCGGGQAISTGCFEALRNALPDTDIYVQHRAATPAAV